MKKTINIVMMILILFFMINILNTLHAEETVCVQVITYAQNPDTGHWTVFSTPCDVPEGWIQTTTPPEGFEIFDDTIDDSSSDTDSSETDNDNSDTTTITQADLEAAKQQGFNEGYKAWLEYSQNNGNLSFADDLNMIIHSIELEGNEYTFTLNYYQNPDDPKGIYWKLDLDSFEMISAVNLTSGNNGETITVNQGSYIAVSLSSNPTTGFEWSILSLDQDIVVNTNNRYTSNCPPGSEILGCGGQEIWQFKAVAIGTTSLEMVYSRPWESIPPEDTFSLTINVVE